MIFYNMAYKKVVQFVHALFYKTDIVTLSKNIITCHHLTVLYKSKKCRNKINNLCCRTYISTTQCSQSDHVDFLLHINVLKILSKIKKIDSNIVISDFIDIFRFH